MRSQNQPQNTNTTTEINEENETDEIIVQAINTDTRRVQWTEETIDNENMGKKSSKCCCVYHKPAKFDKDGNPESSSDDEADHKCNDSSCWMAPKSYHGNA